MILSSKTHESTGFRYRGMEPSRLEGFTDAMFAFSITLLIVSLEVPKTWGELKGTMAGFIGFAFCFAMMVMIWSIHNQFFRRYGLHDSVTAVLNFFLLFIVLFYVYPLKFVFTLTAALFFGAQVLGDLSQIEGPIVPPGAAQEMMTIYGLGFSAVFLTFHLLYRRALAHAGHLQLNEIEIHLTKEELNSTLLMVSIGFISVAIAWLPFSWATAFSGFFYFAIGPAMFIIKWRSRTELEKIKTRLQAGSIHTHD